MPNELMSYIFGIMIAIIGFFVKGLVSEVKELETRVNKNESTIAVLAANHINLDIRIDELNVNIKELTRSIDRLINKAP